MKSDPESDTLLKIDYRDEWLKAIQKIHLKTRGYLGSGLYK